MSHCVYSIFRCVFSLLGMIPYSVPSDYAIVAPLMYQIHGCTDLQNLVTCLDYGDIVIQYVVMQACVRLRDALKYGQLRYCSWKLICDA